MPSGATWWPGCGRKARTWDPLPSQCGRYVVTMIGGKLEPRRVRKAGSKLSAAEGRRVANVLLQPKPLCSGARVLLQRTGEAPKDLVAPKYPADRTRAVIAWTQRLLGRSVGIRACVQGLKDAGVWDPLRRRLRAQNKGRAK